jgi:hypothetical protein
VQESNYRAHAGDLADLWKFYVLEAGPLFTPVNDYALIAFQTSLPIIQKKPGTVKVWVELILRLSEQ